MSGGVRVVRVGAMLLEHSRGRRGRRSGSKWGEWEERAGVGMGGGRWRWEVTWTCAGHNAPPGGQ